MLEKGSGLGSPPVVLAPIRWQPSPNFNPQRAATRYIVWHATAGHYGPSCQWLCNPTAEASAHLVVREDGGEVTQLVKLHCKAWHAFPAWNAIALGVEHASMGAGFASDGQLRQSARVFAWLCHRYGIPPVFGLHRPEGIVRHRDLGAAGGGHTDGPDDQVFGGFLQRVQLELARGGFRKDWARP